ncbi:hypothetical protein [Cohnella sp. REN36]|uniref:hypothetical protein n=1 Tax=Cohnella sp. REN36 TaxID=2887347 RepID=UPI001D142572|nr:hypothetical protein [Cohnella sp. REN36]MCC3373360.1 hypothetical protein [Cohnella sp. REN36]
MSFFDSGPLPNWKEIQNWLGKEIPWDVVEKWDEQNDDSWLEQMVRNFVSPQGEQAPDAKQKTKKHMPIIHSPSPPRVSPDLIKTARHVILTLRLPSEADLRPIRLYAAPDRVRLTGLPGGRSETVRMPCLVYAKSGRAEWKNGQLRIRFRKRRRDREEVELFIQS